MKEYIKYTNQFYNFVLLLIFLSAPFSANASASLSISAASINATGTTLTLTISGASGSLSPSNGITGITLHNDSTTQFYVPASAITASGSTITVPINGFVLSGSTPTVDLSASSNLTDGAADTASGQTGFAITNNSNQNFASYSGTNPGITFIGATTTGTFAGRPWISTDGFLWSTLNGSNAQMLFLAFGSGNITIAVDGISTTTVSLSNLPSNKWVWLKLYSGLSDGPHDVKVTAPYFDASSTIELNGSSPSLTNNSGTFLTAQQIASSTQTTFDGAYALNFLPYIQWANQNNSYPSGAIRFSGSFTKLSAYVSTSATVTGRISFFQDGTQIASPIPGNLQHFTQGFYDLQPLSYSLDGTLHSYELDLTAGGILGGLLFNGTFSNLSTAPTPKPIEAFYGDSITYGGGIYSTSQDMSVMDSWIVTHSLGHIDARVGVSGSKVTTYGRDNTGTVTNIYPTKPVRVWIRYGVNDAGVLGNTQSSIGAAGTPGSFTGDYYTMLANMRAGLASSTPIIVEEIFPTTGLSTSTRATYNAAMVNALNTYIANTSDAYIKLINTDNWFNPSINTVDGIHPNVSGYALIANREIPIAAPAGYTISGPSSGVGVATSTNFTVTIAPGATFTGDQTVTISDGGNGGSFTPSVGTASSSSITVTPTASTMAFTFTYTPASAGTKTLTFSNGQGWTDASSTAYVVSAAPDTTPPAVTLTAAANGSTISGSSVTLTANSSDNVAVVGVQFEIDGTYIGSTGTSSPYSVAWDSTSVADGSHTIYAVAHDAAGNYATSSINVTVHNAVVTVVVPTGGGGNGAPVGMFGGTGTISGPFWVPTVPLLDSTTTSSILINSATTSSKGSSSLPFFAQNHQLYDFGLDIRALQQFLNTHGFIVAAAGPGSLGNETIYFGLMTYGALVNFQQSNGLPATGYLGPLTRSAIDTIETH
ncbi:MAG: Ig-like domain-containing protein [Bradyrhizobium sp.]|nr:Ig-like domain-containing protein [Bradyrhizobium sp.]